MSIDLIDSYTVSKALQYGRDVLKDCSETPELDAQLLLGFVLNISRLEIVVEFKKVISAHELERFISLLERRKKNEPIAYIIGKKEFWGIEFEVTPAVLIPRPDTELLLDMALTYSAEFSDPVLVCELGTGSGCISVALAFELKRRIRNFFILACDISKEALRIAQRNAVNNKLDHKIGFVCSDWNSAIDQEFDLVISNPPYLMNEDPEISLELKFEPQNALYAGEDGLDDYREILSALPRMLSRKGIFLGEIGYGQAHLIESLAKEILPSAQINFHYDLRRVQRVVEIRLHSS